MSLPRYPAYKDSGVSWLGEVPAHWDIKKGCRFFKQIREPSLETDEQLSATQKYGVIPQSLFMVREDQKVMLALGGLDNFKHVECDDFVISLRSFEGGIERSKYIGCVSPAYTVLRANSEFCADFWAFLLKSSSYISALQTMTDGIRDGKNISYAQFGALGIPVPHVHEQIVIARFLDRETAKIDALIAEQEKLITLLAEKRQATISRAVTRGLDPNVPLKDSGVPWLGKVPAHWEVKQLKTISILWCDGPFGSGIKSEHYTDEGAFVVRLQNIRAINFNYGEPVFLDRNYYERDLKRHSVISGDLLVAGLGDDKNLLGRACVAPGDLGVALVKADCFRFRLNSNWAVPDFAAMQLSAGAAFDAGVLATGTTRSRIPLSIMASRKVVMPPISEQNRIVSHLIGEMERLDRLVDSATTSIDLLKERRAALISAAVTGKIDVRGLAA